MTVNSVDIAICTWNRAALLRQTLESVCKLRIPEGCVWRVIVINNNSTDNTDQVLESFRKRLPLVTATEPEQGHTIARNLAVKLSTADLIMWTDDDVVVSEDWVWRTVEAADRFPEAAFFGGPIRPNFPAGQPDWIDANWETLRGCFAERDLGDNPVVLDKTCLPYGANFSVRGDIQRANTFSNALGRRGDSCVGEDELELMRRLCDQGMTGRWVHEAPVHHMITPERASAGYVGAYFAGQGRILASRGNSWTTSRTSLWIQEYWHRVMYQLKRGITSSPVWLGHLARAGLAHGQRMQLKEMQVRQP